MLSAFGVTSDVELGCGATKMKNDGMRTSPAQHASRTRRLHAFLAPPRVGVALYASDPLLSAIDRDLDSRLSATEIARASERLLSLDNNRDGRIKTNE